MHSRKCRREAGADPFVYRPRTSLHCRKVIGGTSATRSRDWWAPFFSLRFVKELSESRSSYNALNDFRCD